MIGADCGGLCGMGDQRGLPKKSNRLFMCQDENENEPEDESFRSFWIKPVTNEPGPQYYDTLKDRFVRHA